MLALHTMAMSSARFRLTENTPLSDRSHCAVHLDLSRWRRQRLKLFYKVLTSFLLVGIGTPFLSEPFAQYGFLLTDCLWSTIWCFISEHKISLSYPDQVLPKRQWQGDEFIMERLIQHATLSQQDLISCNRCRLALEAVTVERNVQSLGWS
jgi:hypothetical protein